MYAKSIDAYCASLQKFVYDIEEALLQYDPEYPPITGLDFGGSGKNPSSFFVANKTERYLADNCTFQGEQDHELMQQLIFGGMDYFSPVGRDNYIKRVERFLEED